MKKFCLIPVALCLFLLALPFLWVALLRATDTASLPNGYYLKHHGGETVYMHDRKGKLVSEHPIDMLANKGDCVYGMLYWDGIGYFFLDTGTGEYVERRTMRGLDEWLEPRGLALSPQGRTHFRALKAREGGLVGKYERWRSGEPQKFDTW